MVEKPILLAFAAILMAKSGFAMPAGVPSSIISSNTISASTPNIADLSLKDELSMDIETITDSSEELESVTSTVVVEPSLDSGLLLTTVTESYSIPPAETASEVTTLSPEKTIGEPLVDDESKDCLNLCAHAMFLGALAPNPVCNSADPKGFYNVAQKCAQCICKVWSVMEEKDSLISSMTKCNIKVPKCNPEDTKIITKRAINVNEEVNLNKRLFIKQTCTVYRTRPPIRTTCNSGYTQKVNVYPAVKVPKSYCYGLIVTYYPACTWPATRVTHPPCKKRTTCHVYYKCPQRTTKKCIPGYKSGKIVWPGVVKPSSTVTNVNGVTIYHAKKCTRSEKLLPPCTKRRTVTVTPPYPSAMASCAPGTTSKVSVIPRLTQARKIITGKNGVVTVTLGRVWKAQTKTLTPCNRKTVTITPPYPSSMASCAPGTTSKVSIIPRLTQARKIITGKNGVVTVTLARAWQARTRTLVPCNRKTVTITPPYPSSMASCAPGTTSKVSVIPRLTQARKIATGKNGVVTVTLARAWNAQTRTLTPCRRRTVTVTPPYPSTMASCAPGTTSKVSVIPRLTQARKIATGKNGVVTVTLARAWKAQTKTLTPCNRKTVTITPPYPSSMRTCAPGTTSKVSIIPRLTQARKVVTGKNGIVTVTLARAWKAQTRTLAPCTKRSTQSSIPTSIIPQPDTSSASSENTRTVIISSTTIINVSSTSTITVPNSETVTSVITRTVSHTVSESTDLQSTDSKVDSETDSTSTPASDDYESEIESTTTPVSDDYESEIESTTTSASDDYESEVESTTTPVSDDYESEIESTTTPTSDDYESEIESTTTPVSDDYESEVESTTTPASDDYDSEVESTTTPASDDGEDNSTESDIISTASVPSETTTENNTTSGPSTTTDNTPPSSTTTKCNDGTCTCVPQPPVCIAYDVYKAFYCGEWIIYRMCTTFGFIGCGYDNIKRRDVEDEAAISAARAVIPTLSASTTTMAKIDEALATALVDEDKSKKIVNAVVVALKKSEEVGKVKQIKIMDPSEIDFSQIEQPKVINKVTILKGKSLNTAPLRALPTSSASNSDQIEV